VFLRSNPLEISESIVKNEMNEREGLTRKRKTISLFRGNKKKHGIKKLIKHHSQSRKIIRINLTISVKIIFSKSYLQSFSIGVISISSTEYVFVEKNLFAEFRRRKRGTHCPFWTGVNPLIVR